MRTSSDETPASVRSFCSSREMSGRGKRASGGRPSSSRNSGTFSAGSKPTRSSKAGSGSSRRSSSSTTGRSGLAWFSSMQRHSNHNGPSARSWSSRRSRDLPTPASPVISTTRGAPPCAWAHAESS